MSLKAYQITLLFQNNILCGSNPSNMHIYIYICICNSTGRSEIRDKFHEC